MKYKWTQIALPRSGQVENNSKTIQHFLGMIFYKRLGSTIIYISDDKLKFSD